MKSNTIFYDWVPRNTEIWLLLLLHVFLAFNGGIPGSITGYVVGGQSVLPADLNMANFAYQAGLAFIFPFVMRLSQFTNTRNILLCSFVMLIFLNYILSVTAQPLVMVMASFVLGAVKMTATIELILALLPILMPTGERYLLYCVYYPLGMIFGPISGLAAVYFAKSLNWEYNFHIQNMLLLFGLLLIILLVHPNLKGKKIPFFQYDWIGTVLIAASLLLGCYVCSYGNMLDWFSSFKIQAASVGSLVSLVLFLQLNFRVKRPYIRFIAFHSWKISAGILVLSVLCLLFNTSALTAPFFTIVFNGNLEESARINTFVIPGYITGSIMCFFYFRKFMNFMPMAVIACVSFLLSNILMYHLTIINVGSSALFWPMFFRAMAAIITYISVGIYITNNMPVHFFVDITMFLVALRSFFVPVIASTIYSNWFYRSQIRYITQLANNMDKLNLYVDQRGATVFGSVKTQAALLGLREIYFALIIIGLVSLIFILVFPFHGSEKRIIINWRDPFHLKAVK